MVKDDSREFADAGTPLGSPNPPILTCLSICGPLARSVVSNTPVLISGFGAGGSSFGSGIGGAVTGVVRITGAAAMVGGLISGGFTTGGLISGSRFRTASSLGFGTGVRGRTMGLGLYSGSGGASKMVLSFGLAISRTAGTQIASIRTNKRA
jgi:hypothetical protein